MINVGVIGVGNCGNQVAKLAFQEAKCGAFAINTSERDLSTVPESIPRKCVGDAQGSGKNRDAAKEFLKANVMDLLRDDNFNKFMTEREVVVVVSSMGGGSGSGIAPILTELIKEAYKTPDGLPVITILVGVLPRLNEGYSTQVNALAYSHELFDIMPGTTYMMFDNNAYAKETSYKVLEKINTEIVDAIKIMQCRYNNPTPYDSIDEKDMKQVLSTPGRLAMFSLFDLKEKDMDEKTIEDLLIERIKFSGNAELQRDGVVGRTGLITNLNPKLNETFDTHINKVREFIGEPIEEMLHVAVNEDKAMPNNVILILSGLSKITDRIDKIRDRIQEIEDKTDALQAEETEITEEDVTEMNKRRASISTSAKPSESGRANVAGVFGKFGL